MNATEKTTQASTEAEVEENLKQLRWRSPLVIVASGLGSGWFPIAPGTFASLIVGLLWWWLLAGAGETTQLIVVASVVIVVAVVLEVLVRRHGYVDARFIVADEIAGVCVAMLLLPNNPLVLLIAFLLFRVLDIWKPFPIRLIDDKMRSGFGILLDDLIAGGMACVVAHALWKIFSTN